MKTRRLTLIGLGLVAALSFAVAGCDNATGTDPSAGEANSSAAAGEDPSAALARSAEELAKTSFKMTMKMGSMMTMDGVMDPQNRLGQATMTITGEGMSLDMQTLMVGGDMYLKMSGLMPGMDEKWMHLDLAKLPATADLPIKPGETDPASAAKLLKAATTVERVGDNGFKGTLDMTRAVGVAGIDADTLTEYGDKAKAVPFEATVDAQGRLSTMKVEMPDIAGEPMTLDVTYSDFGTKVDITKPAPGEVTEAPDAVYGTLDA